MRLADLLRHAIGDAGGDHAAIAVRHQHDVRELLEPDDTQQVLDVGFEAELARRQVFALSHAGIGGHEQSLAGSAHQRTHLLPRPARRPGAMRNQA